MLNLSLRLKTIASLVPRGARVCDVGTDHARLPIYLKQAGIAAHVIATDLNQKPLENAKANLALSGVCDIDLRLCDGLTGVAENEADTVIVAGIGGEVISAILKNCRWLKNNGITLILQPTTSPEVLRRFLAENGFEILSETPVFENNKIYSVMKVAFTGITTPCNEGFYYVGRMPKTAEGIVYIKKQQKRVYECMTALASIDAKRAQYNFYKKVYTQINDYLTESN